MIYNYSELLFVFGLYLLHAVITKRAAFLVAFLSIEVFGISAIAEHIQAPMFYLFYAAIHGLLYFACFYNKDKLTTLLAIVLLIAWQIGNSIDAALYPYTQTIVNDVYPFLYVLLHIFLISTTIKLRKLRRAMAGLFNAVAHKLRVIYFRSLF